MVDLKGLEKKIKVNFKNTELLEESLTHRSYLNENPRRGKRHNERLEYLGDAALELAVSDELFGKFKNFTEGQLTVLRAALVNYQILSKIAVEIGIDKFILMSKGEKNDSAKAREVIFANTIEAVIGAIFLDRGFEEVKKFVRNFIMTHTEEILENKTYRDSKSELQEIVQEKLKVTPVYKVLGESGPAHEKHFKIGVYFGENLIAEGGGSSKQEGELEAAKEALKKQKR